MHDVSCMLKVKLDQDNKIKLTSFQVHEKMQEVENEAMERIGELSIDVLFRYERR